MQDNSVVAKSPQVLLDRISIGKASEYLGVSIDTLRRWEKKGVIAAYRSPGGHRYFLKNDLDKLFGQKYTRTSPTKKSEPVTKAAEETEIPSIPKAEKEPETVPSKPPQPPQAPAQQPSTYADHK